MSIENHLKQIIPEVIAQFPSIMVMYLFGSHASGTPTADSDVDIAVFTDGRETPTMALELGVFLQQQLKRPVDVVIMQKVSPIVQHEVLRNKFRIFEKGFREPDSYADAFIVLAEHGVLSRESVREHWKELKGRKHNFKEILYNPYVILWLIAWPCLCLWIFSRFPFQKYDAFLH